MNAYRTRIKVCGIRDIVTAMAAVEAGADMIGLVFVQQSPRYVTPTTARAIVQSLPPGVEPVGLFSDHSAEDIDDAVRIAGLRTVQLHGREGPGLAKQKPLERLSIIKAIAFEPGHVSERLQPWREAKTPLSAILLDAPPDGQVTGGRGEAFDWQALAEHREQGVFAGMPPIFLAGGLNPQNVANAITQAKPYAVDVSSGVESVRGVKDTDKIAAFCQAVRLADAA
jgi:phosphoribosylanthranilate isomerase